jgi:hypothetical protein
MNGADIGYAVSVLVLTVCVIAVLWFCIDIAAARSAVGGRVWWTISRAKAHAMADFYVQQASAGLMDPGSAYAAYLADIGCLYLSWPWAPDAFVVIDRIYGGHRSYMADEFDARFPGEINVWRESRP